MKLSTLQATFIKIVKPGTHHRNAPFNEAQGILFLCPKCWHDEPVGEVGCHSVICWFRDKGVPDDYDPKPGRWTVSGTGFDDLTLSPSVQLEGGCNWHGFVKDGDAA